MNRLKKKDNEVTILYVSWHKKTLWFSVIALCVSVEQK
jgi:hypothetical protein